MDLETSMHSETCTTELHRLDIYFLRFESKSLYRLIEDKVLLFWNKSIDCLNSKLWIGLSELVLNTQQSQAITFKSQSRF